MIFASENDASEGMWIQGKGIEVPCR